MTYLQLITLFNNIANAHYFIKSFGHGEAWEINESVNYKDYVLWVVPLESTTGQQVKIRTFTLLVFKQVKKDESDETYILSDCERILDDIIRIFRNESTDYDVIGDPVLFPFKEEFGDWVAGWRADVQIETQFKNNYCDIPSGTFVNPAATSQFQFQIKDQNGNILQTYTSSGSYTVEVLQEIVQTLGLPPATIIQTLT
jgi:hypothetical protein